MTSSEHWPCAALHNAELAGRTTLRVGGQAEWLLEPADPDELVAAVAAARERGLEPRMLGGGANLLVDDGLHRGVTITTERMRRLFRPLPASSIDAAPLDQADAPGLADANLPSGDLAPPDVADDPRLVAWAGCTLPALVRGARDLGLSGLEGLAGVPGHVGGGIAMNAGGRWGDTWDVVETVRVLEPDGSVRDLAREECCPSYRNANLGDRIVLGAVLRMEPAPKLEVRARVREYLISKNKVQPVSEHSCGCVFKNPDPDLASGRSAGQLVDDCGGKGLERGEAIVSPLHGNFIVNRGSARSADVMSLIDQVRDLVAQRTGIQLELEVKRWPRPVEA